MTAKLHVGIIAPEFPPEVGGMQIMALQLAGHISKSHEVTVCTKRQLRPLNYDFDVLANLRGKTESDIAALNCIDVDVWLAMNAGYAAIAGKLRKPVVAYFHGNDFLNPWVITNPWLARVLSKLPFSRRVWSGKRLAYSRMTLAAGMARTAKILTNSASSKDLIHKYYPLCRKVVVCHPGVEDRFFWSGRMSSRSCSSVLRLLTVCRLQKGTRRKNVAGVLEALGTLNGKLDFQYTVVGDGDDLQGLKELSERLGLPDRVRFLGRVNDADLLKQYREADLFVLPVKASRLDVEGFGIVYLEANAAGIPVLCSAAGGAVDAVIDKQTGIILTGSEPHQIAGGIQQFADTRANYDSDKLREFAAGFTWKVAASRIEAEVVDVVAPSARKRTADPMPGTAVPLTMTRSSASGA